MIGGEIPDASLLLMNLGGRTPSVGMVSQYDVLHDKLYGLKDLHSIVGMDITLQSYRNVTYEQLLAEMRERLGGWLMEGSMKFKLHIAEGLENLPTAFGGIFSGENFGKTVVKVS